jgi:hypothetical protein
MKYMTQECSFDIPSLTDDRTVNVLTVPLTGTNGTLQVVVSRDRLIAGEDLDKCMQRQIGLMTRHVTSFREIGRRHKGSSALELESSFRQSGSMFYQLQMMTVVEEPRLLVITLSSQVPIGDAHRAIWQQILDSYSPRI